MKLGMKILSNPEEVAKQLKTNIPLSVGKVLYSGSEFSMKKFAADNK